MLTQICGQEEKAGQVSFTTYWERAPGIDFEVNLAVMSCSIFLFSHQNLVVVQVFNSFFSSFLLQTNGAIVFMIIATLSKLPTLFTNDFCIISVFDIEAKN